MHPKLPQASRNAGEQAGGPGRQVAGWGIPVTRVSNGCAEVYNELGLYKPSSLLRPYIADTCALLLSLMPLVNARGGGLRLFLDLLVI